MAARAVPPCWLDRSRVLSGQGRIDGVAGVAGSQRILGLCACLAMILAVARAGQEVGQEGTEYPARGSKSACAVGIKWCGHWRAGATLACSARVLAAQGGKTADGSLHASEINVAPAYAKGALPTRTAEMSCTKTGAGLWGNGGFGERTLGKAKCLNIKSRALKTRWPPSGSPASAAIPAQARS